MARPRRWGLSPGLGAERTGSPWGIGARAGLLAALADFASPAPAPAQESLLQRCLGLPAGSAPALIEYCQGVIANSGSRGPQDPQAALRHYQKAAEMGLAEAQAVLGVAYERGYAGMKADLRQAASWYEKAAAQGYAGAELNLGQLYMSGNGVPRDPVKGRQLIEAAAKQGLAPAQRALAQLDTGASQSPSGTDAWNQARARYAAGDHAGAAKLTLEAAQAGHPTAIYEMGYLYEKGDGVPKDLNEAARWYRMGAEKNEAASEAALGLFYEEGWGGLPDDWLEAAKWYAKSAQQDNELGQFRLGRAYEYGIGVPIDLQRAVAWYDKSAAQGDGQAAFAAKYIRDNHGFDGSSRSAEEQALLGPLIGRQIPEVSPQGLLFHNIAERMDYVRALAANEARLKQLMAHNIQQREYDDCRLPAAAIATRP